MIRKYLALISITALGLLLRLYHLTSISLWHDEAFSALLVRYPWGEMMHRIGLDVHPPLYYVFLRVWHYVFGSSLWSLRGFSVFFGILTIIAVYAFVKTAFRSQKFALVAALLVALNPFQIQYVTEARMYTMGACFAVLAAYFLIKALLDFREGSKGRAIVHYILFGVSCGIMALTHYYLLFTAAALCFFALLYHFHYFRGQIKKYGGLVLSYGISVIMFLPWLKIFLFQYRQVGAGYWIPPMDKWSIPTTLWQMLFGIYKDISQINNQVLIVLGTAFSIYFLYRFLRKTQDFEKWLVIFSVVTPFLGSVFFYLFSKTQCGDGLRYTIELIVSNRLAECSSGDSVFLVRYFLFTSSFYLIALAGWIIAKEKQKVQTILIAVLVILNLYGTYKYWSDLNVKTKPGMAAAAKYLNFNVGPQDKLFVGSSFEFFNFKYYNRTSVKPHLYSGGLADISGLPHFAGTAILTNEDLVPDFKTAVQRGDTIWLVWTNGFGGSKPPVPVNWTQLDEKTYAEVRPYVGTYIYVNQYKVN